MRILFYYAWSLSNSGGAEHVVLELAEALRMRGHRVGMLDSVLARPARRRTSGFDGELLSFPPAAFPGLGPRSWASFLRGVYRFQRVVSSFDPDVVSVQAPSQQSLAVVGACMLPHKWRLVVTAHGSDIRVFPAQEPRLRPWVRRLLQRADAVTAVSAALLRDISTQYPATSRLRRVIHNGIDDFWLEGARTPGATPTERYVLFTGRLIEVKGLDILLRAWQRLQVHAPEVALWVAGEGPEMNPLRALSQDLGVADRVRFLGWVPRQSLPSLYRNAELVALPSRSEGLPLVALEAGACSVICVATQVGGVPEVIEDNVTGLLVEPDSVTAFADALLHALRMPLPVRQHMGTVAKERIAQRFSHEQMVTGYEELFQSLLEPSARRRLGADEPAGPEHPR